MKMTRLQELMYMDALRKEAAAEYDMLKWAYRKEELKEKTAAYQRKQDAGTRVIGRAIAKSMGGSSVSDEMAFKLGKKVRDKQIENNMKKSLKSKKGAAYRYDMLKQASLLSSLRSGAKGAYTSTALKEAFRNPGAKFKRVYDSLKGMGGNLKMSEVVDRLGSAAGAYAPELLAGGVLMYGAGTALEGISNKLHVRDANNAAAAAFGEGGSNHTRDVYEAVLDARKRQGLRDRLV